MDIKTLLKDAKEALKIKDFNTALRCAKQVLMQDKSNYMAMVFLGLAFQEVGPTENAFKAFQKAIALNSSNPLAWQGLISYYDKTNIPSNKEELLKAYISYLNAETNEIKLSEYVKRLCNSYETGTVDALEIGNVLYDTSRKCSCQNQESILKLLAEFLEKEAKDSTEFLGLYKNCLEVLKATSGISETFYSCYLNLLNKAGLHQDVLKHSIVMSSLFPSSIVSLSWICKIFNQSYIEENENILDFVSGITEYVDKLLSLDQKNSIGLFTQAVLLVRKNNFLAAKENLTEVTTQRPGLVYAWILLTDVFLKLQLFEEATESFNRSKKLTKSMNNATIILKKVGCQEIEVLCKSTNAVDWKNALELYYKKETSLNCLPAIIEIFIKLGQFADAEKLITKLKSSREENADVLQIRLLKQQKKYGDATNFINIRNYNFTDWWIEVGLLYWDSKDYQKSLEPFLKAAKCDPTNFTCFIYLGHYYNKFGQLDKARRCYEKAFKLNATSSEAGSELSKIYRKQKNWEANRSLLTSLTKDSITHKSIWAWLQLGLAYLEQGDSANAIDYLRMVLRLDPDNIHCWESLADAYFSRGSFTAALKCYEKASDLTRCSLYSTLQVAYIKMILGEFVEAKENFDIVLKTNCQYVPALKGLGETSFFQAKECYKDQRLGTARDHSQIACNNFSLAILQRSELSCLWKMLGDCILFVAKLPEKYSFLKISKTFLESKESEESTILEQDDLFSFATKCYCKAVSLKEDNAFLWYDLGTSYLAHALHSMDKEKRLKTLQNAFAVAQHCTQINPENWQHWNLLGNVAFYSDPPNYAMAQHCFIKAVIAEPNSAVGWTNLGILYLHLDDIKLANKAFSEGQRSDPNYVNSWIGQAIIAEIMGHSDAMDLFRHSTQLGQHQQGSIGYGHWVCQVLLNNLSTDKDVHYSIYNMNAIPVACDVMNWFTEKNPYDACAWNMLGILYERLGLKMSSKDAFKKALAFCDKNHKDPARVNYGRLLYYTGHYQDAIQMFRNVEEATFSSGAGLALALFRDGQYEESYSAYEQALHWLTDEQTYQSDLLVALASMAYKFQGPVDAKTLLFQSIELKPPSPWSLYATFALALLHNEIKIAQLVCEELNNMETHVKQGASEYSEYIYHYSALLAHLYWLHNDKNEATVGLSKLVHKHPHEACTWINLSQLIFRMHNDPKKLKAAAKCASIAMNLDHKNLNISKQLCLCALSFYLAGDFHKALVFAQKAVHYRPDISDGWATLLPLLSRRNANRNLQNIHKDVLKYLSYIKCNDRLLKWTKEYIGSLSV